MVEVMNLIFDTSAINKLMDDPDGALIVAGLSAGYHFLLTANAVSEIAANQRGGRRSDLLNLCRPFLTTGWCLHPFHWLIRRLCSHSDPLEPFRWRLVNPRLCTCEAEIVRRQMITNELSIEEYAANQNYEAQFKSLFVNARPAIQKGLGGPAPQNLAEVINLRKQDGAFSRIAQRYFLGATNVEPLNEAGLDRFVSDCPPFYALMLSTFMAEYEYCVRDLKRGPSFRAGRVDMFSAVFLPYCDTFVTDERKQYRCLREIESIGQFRGRNTALQ